MIITQRLCMIPATEELVHAEISDRQHIAGLLGTCVPDNWPPELMIDAFPWFYEQISRNPGDKGWYYWYVLLTGPDSSKPSLVGSIGFKGKPDIQGNVEIGYSVLPEYRKRGIAGEMISALVAWAFSHSGVTCVFADTSPENTASCKALVKSGFVVSGTGAETGTTRFVLKNSAEYKFHPQTHE